MNKTARDLRGFIAIVGIFLLIVSIGVFIYGAVEANGTGNVNTGDCYKCDGIGKIKKNGVVVECPICDGLGVGFWRADGVNIYGAKSFVGIIIGLVLLFVNLRPLKLMTQADDSFLAKAFHIEVRKNK